MPHKILQQHTYFRKGGPRGAKPPNSNNGCTERQTLAEGTRFPCFRENFISFVIAQESKATDTSDACRLVHFSLRILPAVISTSIFFFWVHVVQSDSCTFVASQKNTQSTAWEFCFNLDVWLTWPFSSLCLSFSVFSMGRRRCVRTAWTPTSRTSTFPSWTPATSTASTVSASYSGATISRRTHRRPPSTTVQQMSSLRWGFFTKIQFSYTEQLVFL